MNIETEMISLNGDEKENRAYNNLAKRRILLYLILPLAFLFGLLQTARRRKQHLYKGTGWMNPRTIAVDTIGETKFARCDLHTVRSEDGNGVFKDWLFLEEVNAVNIVIQTAEGKFIVFEQEKYAIPGKTLSPVGGLIDEGESPLTSAKREVLEELGLGSKATLEKAMEMSSSTIAIDAKVSGSPVEQMKQLIQLTALPDEFESFPTSNPNKFISLSTGNIPLAENDPDWVFLGRYRTAANRGGGFLYSYLLKNAIPIVPNGGTAQYVSEGDDESQSIAFLNVEQLMEMVSGGRFQEVKWAATFALSLLHLKDGVGGCCSGNRQSAGLCFGDKCS